MVSPKITKPSALASVSGNRMPRAAAVKAKSAVTESYQDFTFSSDDDVPAIKTPTTKAPKTPKAQPEVITQLGLLDGDKDNYEVKDSNEDENDYITDSDEGDHNPAQASLKRKATGSVASEPKRQRLITITAKEVVDGINAKHPVAPEDPDVANFRRSITNMVTRLKEWVQGHPGNGQLLCWSTMRYLRSDVITVDSITSKIFDAMPLRAQQILGNPALQYVDLLRLPDGC